MSKRRGRGCGDSLTFLIHPSTPSGAGGVGAYKSWGPHLLERENCRVLENKLRPPPKFRPLVRLRSMLSGRAADVQHCVLTSRWLPAAVPLLLLLLSSSIRCAHSTTVEHDFQIVHNVDNRSPEIDPFWYVGRGVRPIGRFGKRHSSVAALDSGGMQPVIRTLELLLGSLRNKQTLEKVLSGENRDWLP